MGSVYVHHVRNTAVRFQQRGRRIQSRITTVHFAVVFHQTKACPRLTYTTHVQTEAGTRLHPSCVPDSAVRISPQSTRAWTFTYCVSDDPCARPWSHRREFRLDRKEGKSARGPKIRDCTCSIPQMALNTQLISFRFAQRCFVTNPCSLHLRR